MLKIEVASQIPEQMPGQIAAWIDLGTKRALAKRATVEQHPGWEDVARRLNGGPITSPYLSASVVSLLVLPGQAAKYYPDREKIKTMAAEALSVARERRCSSLVFLLDAQAGGDAAGDVAEGLALHAYRFEKYKKNKNSSPDPEVTLVVPSAAKRKAGAEVERRLLICQSVNRARDLINEPGSVATPAEIEAQARAVAKAGGLKIDVLDVERLKKEGYEGLLSVGRGGAVPPRMIVLSYNPAGAKSNVHLGLLGKGVTFDTGGVSIKPSAKMWEMKGDMSGASAVLYGMEVIAALKPKIRVTAIIVTAQNYVDANAIVPGDMIRGRNGKTIHVDNTDAEGRLILTDGLWRAGEEKVTHLADFATLTGAIVRALGTSLSGAFGNDAWVDRVMKIADSCGETCWKMPLVDEYIELLKCDVADINNIGSKPEGGAIQAAIFLREFVPEGISWAHLDIAGTFLLNSKWKYLRPGGVGVMVKTIAALAQDMAGRS